MSGRENMFPKKSSYITKLLVIIWLAIWLLDAIFFTKATSLGEWFTKIWWNSNGRLNDLLALVPARLEHYEYWRVISYAFTHTGLLHIVGNSLLISFAGNILETHVSTVNYILPILLGDILSGLGCMLYANSTNAYIHGSSPGIYALYGMLVSNLYFRNLNSSAYMSRRIKHRFIIILIAVNFLGIDTFIIHAIGFAVGLCCGLIQAKCNHRFQKI
jgi:rhomboid protease GluP